MYWIVINRILAIMHITIGFAILYKIFDLAKMKIEYIEKLPLQNKSLKFDINPWQFLLQNEMLFAIGILLAFSGILILWRKKLGWIFGYSSWILTILALIPITLYGITNVTVTTIGPENLIKIYSGIGLLLSVIFVITLSLQPIRILNRIDTKSWFFSFGMMLLIYYLLPLILKAGFHAMHT